MKYQLHNKSYIGATLHPQRIRKAKLRVQGSTLLSLRVPSIKNGDRVSFGLMLDKKKASFNGSFILSIYWPPRI